MNLQTANPRRQRQLGRFVLGRRLGRGSFGTVWEATDPLRPGERLALKVLSKGPTVDPDHPLSPVSQEFRLASRVRHPVVLEFLEGGHVERGGRRYPYLLSELVRGAPLGPPWEPRRLRPVAEDLLSALDAIHSAGLRHGDIQPRNILVRQGSGGSDRPDVRLLDFGLAEESGRGGVARRTGGTPRYLAPEVLRGAAPDYRADLYALGLLLYECLRGPIGGTLADHLLRTRQGVFFEDVCSTSLPERWSRLLRRLLDPDPDFRVARGAEGLALLGKGDGSRAVPVSLPAFEAARPVGDRSVFDALATALEPSELPRPGLVVVEGGGGHGKTRVIREAVSGASVAGMRTYGWDAVRALAGADDDDASQPTVTASGWDEAWLRRAVLAPSGASRQGGEEAARAERVAAAIFDYVTRQKTLIAVDDLDDLPPTERLAVRLFVEKVRNLRGYSRIPASSSVPLVVLTVSTGTLRRGEYAAWWERLSSLPWTTHVSLRSWAPEEVADYLNQALPPRRRLGEFEAALRREGNPGRLRRLLQELAARRELVLEDGVWVCHRSLRRGLPQVAGDRDVFRRDWDRANGATRDLLGVAAVWSTGDAGVPLSGICSALGMSREALSVPVRHAASLEFLAPEIVGRGGASDRLILKRGQRLWIARAAGPGGRARWRRRIADSNAPLSERVCQELRLGSVPLSRILAAAREGGPAAERLLSCHASDSRRPASDRAATARRLGEMLHALGEFRRAERYLLAARDLVRGPDTRLRIDLLLGEAAVFGGRPTEAEKIFERVLRTLPPEDPLRPRFLCDAALCRYMAGNLHDALTAAEGALEESPGDLALQNLIGVAAWALGREAQAERVLRSALLEAAQSTLPGVQAMLRTNYGLALRRCGRIEEAEKHHRQAAVEFEEGGLRSLAARAFGNLGVGLRRRGEYEAAVEAATRSLELHREVGDEQGIVVAEVNLGILARELGLRGTAWRRFRASEMSASGAKSLGQRVQDHPAALENRLLLALEVESDARIEELVSRRDALPMGRGEGSELLPETLLVELRLWRAGWRKTPARLLRVVSRRDFDEADSPLLSELATNRLRRSRAGGESADLDRMADRARRALQNLAMSSPRATFYCRLVELEDPGSEAERARAVRYLKTAVHRFPVRDARLRALRGLAEHAPDRETRETSRSGLRRLADEVLLDMEPSRREIYRRRTEFKEVFEMTRAMEAAGPALKRARQVVQEILRFNGEILEETRLESLVRKIVDAAMAITDAERGVLVMRERGQLKVLVARSRGEDLPDPREHISHTLLERALEEGVARLTTDAREDLTLKSVASVEELGLRSVLCVPLRAKRSRVLGALYLDNPFERAVFDTEDLSLAETFCSQAALAWAAAARRRQTASLLRQVRRANRELKAELCVSRRDLARRSRRAEKQLEGIVGDSAPMREVFHLIEVVAPTEIPVLITGESGTGKELVARAIHRLSHRSARPFVAENCGAVPAGLLESALFGHVRGAFTGADRESPGIFQMADGGTLFLDEIAEMPIELQTRLLRVLQEGEVRPLGARRSVRVDVRVVAATNRDVRAAMEKGTFREDLYYRLQGAEIHVPALRDNAADVPLLVEHFLETVTAGDTPKKVSLETMERLRAYSWPGNVRELENEMRRLVVLCPTDLIGPEYLSPPIRSARRERLAEREETELRTLREVERRAILDAMERLEGNRVKVAKALGISRSTLYLKLKEVGYPAAHSA